jgi:hypothetical protein
VAAKGQRSIVFAVEGLCRALYATSNAEFGFTWHEMSHNGCSPIKRYHDLEASPKRVSL